MSKTKICRSCGKNISLKNNKDRKVLEGYKKIEIVKGRIFKKKKTVYELRRYYFCNDGCLKNAICNPKRKYFKHIHRAKKTRG